MPPSLDEVDLDSVVLQELELEIRIRERLASVINERIKWANALRDCLNSGKTEIETDFQTLAVSVLNGLQAPIHNLYDLLFTEPPVPPLCQTEAVSASAGKRSKPLTRSSLVKKNKASSFLFIRGTEQDKNEYFVLRCPDCNKIGFTNLQGLYNHARISHKIEWGNHEECVKVCAVKATLEGQTVHVEDTTLDLAEGIQVGNSASQLPGVRSLFQMAVEGAALPRSLKRKRAESVDLNATLGIHAETPAIAAFLGKQAKRRIIHTEDQDVDIMILSEAEATKWKKTYAQRSRAVDEHVGEFATPMVQHNPIQPVIGSSRFHFSARVIVTDRSLYFPPDKRTYEDKACTHKWMISVEAPAYSHDITTLLTRIEVQGPNARLNTSEPPFLVVSTAAESFTAKIELWFAPTEGTDQPQRILLTHYIELDSSNSRNVTVGSRHVVDIDLDKNTKLLHKQTGYEVVGSRKWWDDGMEKGKKVVKEESRDDARINGVSGYERVLKSLLPKFPLTLKDIQSPNPTKMATSLKLPYRLVTSREAFKTLVLGRKKAIEWGLATALHAAYTDHFLNSIDTADEDLVQLTIGDVYNWCVDEGYFVREKEMALPPSAAAPRVVRPGARAGSVSSRGGSLLPDGGKNLENAYCSVCGMTLLCHPGVDLKELAMQRFALSLPPPVGSEHSSNPLTSPTFQCTIAPALYKKSNTPLLHVGGLFLGYGYGGTAWQWLQQQQAMRTLASNMPHLAASHIQSSGQAQGSSEPAGSSRDREGDVDHSQNQSAISASQERAEEVALLFRRFTHHDIVDVADPGLVVGVMKVVAALKLPHCCIPTSSAKIQGQDDIPVYPLSTYGSNPLTTDKTIAPYALLSLAVKQFIKVLVDGGTEIGRREVRHSFTANSSQFLVGPSTGSSTTSASRSRRPARAKPQLRVLTPIHILSAVVHGIGPVPDKRWSSTPSVGLGMSPPYGVSGSAWNELSLAVFGCLSRLGIGANVEGASQLPQAQSQISTPAQPQVPSGQNEGQTPAAAGSTNAQPARWRILSGPALKTD